MRRRGLSAYLCSTLLAMVLGGCAGAVPTAEQTEDKPKPTPAAASPAPAGPKKRVAVAKFDAAGAFVAAYGGWDIGGGLAAQLVTELLRTGRFIVVERAQLASVLREQEMGLTKIVAKDTAAQIGRVLGAQLLVMGSVTEFEQRAGGGGVGVGVGGFSVGGALGLQSVTGHVAIDVRLVDTTTGQVVQSHVAEATTSERGVSATISAQQVSLDGEAFSKTPLGQATRQAIQNAVAFVVAQLEKVPWLGRVVDVIDGKLYLNAGSDSNLRPGDRFVVSTVVRELTDPGTGLSLGALESRLGEVEVESVQEKFAVARPLGAFPAKRGDLVRPK